MDRRTRIWQNLCVVLVCWLLLSDVSTSHAQTLKTTLKGHTDEVSSLAFSLDGKTLASLSWDETIKLWDVATGTLKATLKGHTSHVWDVTFHPNGKTLVSGSADKTIKLWDVSKLK